MVKIAFLVDHPEIIPTLAGWFRTQWGAYYAGRTLADIAQDFHSEAKRHGLPVRLIAFSDDELAGTITLREQAISDLPGYSPGLGGLLVVERLRGRGIGTTLVKTGMDLAAEEGYDRVFATTAAAGGILERLGWERVKTIAHGDEQLGLYCCEFEKSGST